MSLKIQFGGRERTLKFKPSSMRDFEQAHGYDFLEKVSTFSYGILASLLYLGLVHEDTGLTAKKVIDYLDQYVEEGGDPIVGLWNEIQRDLALSGLFGESGKAKAQKEGAAPV